MAVEKKTSIKEVIESFVWVAIFIGAGTFAWNSFTGKELEGAADYRNCTEVVRIQPDNYRKYFKDFICSPYGQCVNMEYAGGWFSGSNSCRRAYIYDKKATTEIPVK